MSKRESGVETTHLVFLVFQALTKKGPQAQYTSSSRAWAIQIESLYCQEQTNDNPTLHALTRESGIIILSG